MITKTYSLLDEEGFDEEIQVPAHYEVCPRCDGRGTHDHPAFANGISPEQFAEDPDFKEAYFQGVYDVPCSLCQGQRVVLEANYDQIERRTPGLYRRILEYEKEQAHYEAQRRSEERWGF